MKEHPIPPEPIPSAELPPLHSSTLDLAQLDQLFADVESCTQLLEVLPKYSAQAQVPEGTRLTLAQARTLLETRALRGLQLRYHYDGAEWWDTLMVAGEQFRIVRIRHDFAHLTNTESER